jgi:hypothetical protein
VVQVPLPTGGSGPLLNRRYQILTLFKDPKIWGKEHGIAWPAWYAGGKSDVLEVGIPSLKGKRELYDIMIRDLHSRGLFPIDGLHTTSTGGSLLTACITDLGKAFILFVTEPSASS